MKKANFDSLKSITVSDELNKRLLAIPEQSAVETAARPYRKPRYIISAACVAIAAAVGAALFARIGVVQPMNLAPMTEPSAAADEYDDTLLSSQVVEIPSADNTEGIGQAAESDIYHPSQRQSGDNSSQALDRFLSNSQGTQPSINGRNSVASASDPTEKKSPVPSLAVSHTQSSSVKHDPTAAATEGAPQPSTEKLPVTVSPTEGGTPAPVQIPSQQPTQAAPTERMTEAPVPSETEHDPVSPTETPTESTTGSPTETPTEQPTENVELAPTAKWVNYLSQQSLRGVLQSSLLSGGGKVYFRLYAFDGSPLGDADPFAESNRAEVVSNVYGTVTASYYLGHLEDDLEKIQRGDCLTYCFYNEDGERIYTDIKIF